GFGGAIPAYYLSAAGARVVMLERGPRLATADFTQDLRLDTYPRIVDLINGAPGLDGADAGTGMSVIAANCVGGGSVVYFAASLRAPSFVFERRGTLGRRLWPAAITRRTLDRYYRRVERVLPVAQQGWNDISYAGGLWAAACARAGHTCNPLPVAVDLRQCTSCNWMLNGCVFGAKRSMLLNYLPAAETCATEIRPLHEVQSIAPATTAGFRYAVNYNQVDPNDYRVVTASGRIEAKLVILAAGAMGTPIILQRSAPALGGVPAAVGRYFSPNGDRVTLGVFDETKIRDLLGLERAPGTPYGAYAIGRPITTASYDYLDATRPEFLRFSLQQIYFPPIVNVLAEDGIDGPPTWFGVDKRALTARYPSWLTVLAMTEDANEGVFGPPPPTGNFTRVSIAAGLGQLSYPTAPETQQGWDASDAAVKAIVEQDGLAQHSLWKAGGSGYSAHPLSSCRLGDDPATSALDDRHELRGHPGIFVTDGSAVPTSLCVNPSLTIAALAERASALLLRRAGEYDLALRTHVPLPGRTDAARRRRCVHPV
ncbi:MAG TPA: GMC family oxidoreductase, partial [Solirubrobacteraceae bacterium]